MTPTQLQIQSTLAKISWAMYVQDDIRSCKEKTKENDHDEGLETTEKSIEEIAREIVTEIAVNWATPQRNPTYDIHELGCALFKETAGQIFITMGNLVFLQRIIHAEAMRSLEVNRKG